MTQTANTSALPTKKSEALKQRLRELEAEQRRASAAVRAEEPGADATFTRLRTEKDVLLEKIAGAEEKERAEAAKEAEARREEKRARIIEEGKLYSLARLEAFRAEKVKEAVELEARLDQLYGSIVDAEDAAHAARVRLTREANEAGLPTPQIPFWVGTERAIQSAIHDAHQRRAVSAVDLPPQIRQLKESAVPFRAERARNLLVPRRFG